MIIISSSFNVFLLFCVAKLNESLLTVSSISDMTSCFYSKYVSLITACLSQEDEINDFAPVMYIVYISIYIFRKWLSE